jgi:hypothetical protein
VEETLKGLRQSIPFHRRLQHTLMDIRNSVNRMLGTTPCEELFQRILQTRVPAYRTARVINPEQQSQAKAEMATNHDSGTGVCPRLKLKSWAVVVLHNSYTHPKQTMESTGAVWATSKCNGWSIYDTEKQEAC